MTQERIAEMEKQLQELTKQLAEIKNEQPVEFAKGWNYFEAMNGRNFLSLNPHFKGDKIFDQLMIDLGSFESDDSTEIDLFKSMDRVKSHRPATPEEIKNALTEVCKRKGIVPGAIVKRPESFITISDDRIVKPIVKLDGIWSFVYYPKHDTLSVSGWHVYQNGQFAEVVKEQEEKITIGGYEVKFSQCTRDTKIAGYLFPYGFWQAAKVVAENNKAAVIVGCGAKDKGQSSWVADLETINKILKQLEK